MSRKEHEPLIFGLTRSQVHGMRIYGLTGGIGTGKSEVSKILAERGFGIVDADKIGHEVIAPGGAAEQEVLKAFGENILTHGKIDREKLGAIVFGDRDALNRLNSIVHPKIGQEMAARCLQYGQSGVKAAIIDAPLLVETGSAEGGLDGLIVVTCSAETQRKRLMERRGMTSEEVDRRIGAQAPQDEKIRKADWVVENDGTLDELRENVNRLAEELLADAF